MTKNEYTFQNFIKLIVNDERERERELKRDTREMRGSQYGTDHCWMVSRVDLDQKRKENVLEEKEEGNVMRLKVEWKQEDKV